MRHIAALVFCFAALGGSSPAARMPPDTQLSIAPGILFHLQRDELKLRYSIQLQEDGSGAYWLGPPDFDATGVPGAKAISAGAATRARVFAASAAVRSGSCETRSKNIAQTGRKTLMLLTQGTPRCEFNYSDDPHVNDAVAAFEAMAETLQLADKLTHDKRFDHLGLAADLETLTAEAKSGRAIELGNIAPVLQAIAGDDDLMGVVQRRAQGLLEMARTER